MEIRIYWMPDGNQFIGKTAIEGGTMRILESPRMVKMMPSQRRGEIEILFLPLLGDPKQIYINGECFWWELKDQKIIKGYQQEITGLTLATSIPELH